MSYNIVQKTTPNKSDRKGWKPDMIISHITEGSYNGAVSWLMNPKSGASSHFVVSKTGHITQLVPITEMAWINGTTLNPGTSRYFGHSKLRLVRERKTNANYYSIGIEHEGFSAQGQGKLTEAQYQATLWLHKHIITEVKRLYGIDIPIDRDHIAGHSDVTPKWKPFCPGKNYPFDRLIKDLKADTQGDTINMIINGRERVVPGKNIAGNTSLLLNGQQIDIRDLGEMLGFKVGWDPNKKAVKWDEV
jgi:N-acetyl-anhydromuramyl-L-alanine amidase AmpD